MLDECLPGASLPICFGPAMNATETARLLLRRWQDDDLERLVALYADPQVARFLSVDGRPWPRERSVGAFEHFRRQWQERGFGPWAAVDKASGRWLGQIGLNKLPRWPGPATPPPGGSWRSAAWSSRRSSPTRAPWLRGTPPTEPTGRPASQ
jgi:RimJ/RimL family protein N-acetyltransferase